MVSIQSVFKLAPNVWPSQANRWRKRGLSVVPLKFGLDWNNSPFTVLVSVYATDGTVAITHGGVEVGQGIDTKVPGALGTGPALPAYCSISMPCKVAQVA